MKNLESGRMSALKHWALGTTASGIALMLMAAGGAALAQTTDQSDQSTMETVTVTGFRASLENTIALKKNSTEIIEAVSAEDIGKLPDQSIAEAISRLPGVATQRLNGRAQDISIRGLSADFATTLLNGREQVSTNDNRSVQFDQYPAELMSGVVVYKTPAADLVGAGLSGTIDMRTIRPLDYDHRVISVNARGETNSLGELNPKEGKYGYRFGGTYIDQYADGKLGVMIGVALMDSLNPYNEYAPWGWPNGNGGVVPSNDFAIGGAKFNSVVDNLKRNAAIATFQYRPNENFESTLDLFATTYRDDWQVARVEAPLYSWGGQDLLPGATITNGYATAGTWTPGVKAVSREESDRHNNDLFAFGWKNTYNAGPWTATLDAGYSSVQRHSRLLENWAGTGVAGTGAVDPMPFTMNADNIMHVTPEINYGDYNNMLLTAPQNWGGPGSGPLAGTLAEGYLKYDKVHDHMFTLKGEVQRDLGEGFFKDIVVGVYYTNRTKTKSTDEYFLTSKATADAATAYAAAHGGSLAGFVQTGSPIPTQYRTGVSKGLSYFGIPGFAAWNADQALDSGGYVLTHNTGVWAYQKGYDVNEIVYTGYIKTDIDGTLGEHALTGNAGAQFVLTHQGSSGYAVSWPNAYPIHGGAEYGELLPSLNLALAINDESKIRLGAARELVRARMDQMVDVNSYGFSTASQNVNCPTSQWTNCSPWSGSTGNPKLKPWIADAVDLSYEYYHGNATYLAVAGFYKNLESYIYTQKTPFDFTGYVYPAGYTPQTFMGYVTEDVNGTGGQITGVEVSGAIAGNAITNMFDGFGATANMSYTDSGMKGVSDSGPSTPLPGLSKFVYNITVYYENAGFSARVNYNYRSRFFSEIKGFDNTYTRNEFKEQGWLGAQIGYTFQEGTLNGLSVNLQADNLLHETQTMYQFTSNPNDARQVLDWWRFGTTYQFGLTYKLN
ncbi:MAG: TonB-dependent receptor [Alphaproteobacteria bacterium]|nr:TonB-dependent receptor [Alphaproteobacteria bacterium]